MKNIKYIALYAIAATTFMAYSQSKIILTTGQNSMVATLVDNDATSELTSLLKKGPITIQMNDYGGFEKVGTLPQSFTTSNTQITTEPGDIMLYQGNQMVIFYGSNSWSYTRLGKIEGVTSDKIKEFLGIGPISLSISLDSSTDNQTIYNNLDDNEKIYDLNGLLITHRPLNPGLYIINGVKRRL